MKDYIAFLVKLRENSLRESVTSESGTIRIFGYHLRKASLQSRKSWRRIVLFLFVIFLQI